MNQTIPQSKRSGRMLGIASSVVMLSLLASCNFSFMGIGDSGLPSTPKVPSSEGRTVDIRQPVRVALLVPNNGSDANLNAIGDSIENSAKLALDRQSRGDIDLKIYRTGGDPARAAQMAAQAEAEGAAMIIGPLKSEEAGAADNAASIPLMSFSNNSDIVAENVYILGTTLENVADRVIRYQKGQGGKALGIVYPNNLSGTLGQQASKRMAEDSGVRVVAEEPYILTQGDIAASGPSIAQDLRKSGADMVMFTDYPSGGLGLIGVALRNNDFTNKDAQYLGLSRWEDNAAQLSDAGFEGGLYTLPDPARSSEFETIYRSAYGSAPHSIGSLGYDGVLAAILLVRNARRTNDTTPFSSKDIEGLKFYGASGVVRFQNHVAWRGLAVMRLTGDRGVVVSQAPKDM